MLRLVTILTLIISTIISSVLVVATSAQETTVFVDPPSQVVPDVGESFTLNISIGNVTNLYGYDFMLWYNTRMIDCLDVEWPDGHFLTPTQGSTNIFRFKHVNATMGAVRVVATLIGDEPLKNGSGILVSIFFNSTAPDGPSPIQFNWPGYVYPVKLSDRNGAPIPCTATDGAVTVVSELNTLVTLIVTALATVLLLCYNKQRGRATRSTLVP